MCTPHACPLPPGVGSFSVHPYCNGPAPASSRPHSPDHKHSCSCIFSQLLTCLEGSRVRGTKKSKNQGQKDQKRQYRQAEACWVGGQEGLHSGPDLRQIWVPGWVMRSHSIFLSLSLVRFCANGPYDPKLALFMSDKTHTFPSHLTTFSKRPHLDHPT